jgi:tyrosine-protein kinase Etk/Wzc
MNSTQLLTIDLSFLRSRTVLKRIAVVTLGCAVLGLLYGFLAPQWYSSVLTLVPAKQQKPGLGSMLGGDLAGLAATLEGPLGGADGARIAAVLQSNAVSDAAIAKFDLRRRYREKYQRKVREELWRHCAVKVLSKPNLVQLTCEDKDPVFVRELLEFFAEHGNQVFRRVGVSSASEEVRFLEGRVAELRKQADDAAARMREFQEAHKIVDLDTQAKAVVSALATLNGQRITKQMELEYSRTFSSGDEATSRQLRSQLRVMNEKLRELEEPAVIVRGAASTDQGRGDGGGTNDMFPAALAVPKLRAEFETLYRDRRVAETTLVFALERYEAAKATEARDVSTFLVLDPPTLPDQPTRPRRLRSLALMTAIGFVGAIVFEWSRTAGARALLRAVLNPDVSSNRAAA